jgi:hypothetical protein
MESASLSDALINLIPIYGPWIIFGIVGNAVVFFRRFIAVLRMFAALLAGANCMPAGRFFFFNMTGGVCWACLFVFGAYAVGAEIYKISGTLSVISLGLFIAARYPLPIFIRRNEVTLRCRAGAALSDHSCGLPTSVNDPGRVKTRKIERQRE